MSVDATMELFEHVELFGKPALFTNSRVDVCTVPLGFSCYNLRGSDNDPGRLATLELYVGVNHAGTVLTPEPVKIPKTGYKRLQDGLNFLGDEITLKEFCAEYKLQYCPRFEIRPASNDEAGIFMHRRQSKINRWAPSVMPALTLDQAVKNSGIPGTRAGKKV